MSKTLVSFATARLRFRQGALHCSARRSGAVDRSEKWSIKRLRVNGFDELCPGIDLSERGVGYWVWKPFIIAKTLDRMRDGEVLVYCDVGRHYPWKQIDRRLEVLVDWMDARKTDIFPGVCIPWHGPMAWWTKRSAFIDTGSDTCFHHKTIPVQASFSLWRKSPSSLRMAREWLELCRNRSLVSDEIARGGPPELPGFKEHRHDQSLWTILCAREGLEGFDVGENVPPYDEKNPAEIARILGAPRSELPLWLKLGITMASNAERLLR